MSDSNRITANEDFLHDQTEDLLPLQCVESFGADTQLATELGQCCGQAQVSGLIL
jgi:hypothetical protein